MSAIHRNAATRLELAIRRKFKTPGAALAALGFDSTTIDEIVTEEKAMMTKRRLARDELEMPINAEQAIETIQQIFDGLEDDQAADLATMIEQRLDAEPGAQDGSFRRGRRARDNTYPNQFRSASTGSLTGVGVPDPRAQDRRRARDRRPVAADSAGLPSFEELFPGAARRFAR
jgi:hypothetical protein